MTWPAPPPSVVKSVEDAVAVQEAEASARLSVTVIGPSSPVMMPPGTPEPRFAEDGAVSVSAPVVTAKVTIVAGSLPAGGSGAGAAGAGVAWAWAGAAVARPPTAAGDSMAPVTTPALSARASECRIDPPV